MGTALLRREGGGNSGANASNFSVNRGEAVKEPARHTMARVEAGVEAGEEAGEEAEEEAGVTATRYLRPSFDEAACT